MEVRYRRCAGLDVHKDTVVACVRLAKGRQVRRETQVFGTCTRDLAALGAWLRGHEVTHVALEATGVYWKPVWHVLAEHCALVLANATAVRNVPGRKSDVSDAARGSPRARADPPELRAGRGDAGGARADADTHPARAREDTPRAAPAQDP